MGSLRTLAFAGALASVTASTAFAGDLPPPAAIPEAPVEASYDDDSGFYLRGDIGVGISTADSISVIPTPAPASRNPSSPARASATPITAGCAST
jgi:hypothetical protein